MPPDTGIVPVAIPVPTLEPAIARLSQTLSNLTTSHSNNIFAMTSAADELAQIEEREKELREAIERTETQRSWFAAFCEFVEGVAHFLDEKVRHPLLFLELTAHTISSIPLWRNSRRNTSLYSKKDLTYLQDVEKRKMRTTCPCSWAVFPRRHLRDCRAARRRI